MARPGRVDCGNSARDGPGNIDQDRGQLRDGRLPAGISAGGRRRDRGRQRADLWSRASPDDHACGRAAHPRQWAHRQERSRSITAPAVSARLARQRDDRARPAAQARQSRRRDSRRGRFLPARASRQIYVLYRPNTKTRIPGSRCTSSAASAATKVSSRS